MIKLGTSNGQLKLNLLQEEEDLSGYEQIKPVSNPSRYRKLHDVDDYDDYAYAYSDTEEACYENLISASCCEKSTSSSAYKYEVCVEKPEVDTVRMLYVVTSPPGGVHIKYCDEYVCLSVRLTVCYFVCSHISKTTLLALLGLLLAMFPALLALLMHGLICCYLGLCGSDVIYLSK